MFEIGDKVICIDDRLIEGNLLSFLTNGKVYEILDNVEVMTVSVMNDINIPQRCYNWRFMSIPEYRKIKLQKICTKLEIK